jgi:hypothetical protein
MLSLDLFDSKFEKKLHEGAVDNLEARRIDDLNMRMLELLDRAKEPAYKKNPAALAGLKKQFQKIKAERDSYFKINPATGMDPTGSLGTTKGKLDEVDPPQRPPAKGLLKGKDLVTPQQRVVGATPPQTSMMGKARDTLSSFANWLAGKDDTGPTYESELKENDPNSAINAAKFAYEQIRKAHDTNVDTATIRWMNVGEPVTMSRNQIYHTVNKLKAMSRQNRNAFALQTLANRNNFNLWLGSQKKITPRPQLKQPTDPFQPELPLGKPKIGPVQERIQKKKSDDIQAGDVKVARELQKLRAQYPAARSDVEAVARAEIDSSERSGQQIAAIRGANEKQDALLKQLVALDREQGKEIDSLDQENNGLEKQLARIQATNARLQQTIGQMTGTKKSSRDKTQITQPVATSMSEPDPTTAKKVQDLEAQINQLQARPSTPDIEKKIDALQSRINALPAQAVQALNIDQDKKPTSKSPRPQVPAGDLDIEPPKKRIATAKTSKSKPKTSRSKVATPASQIPDNDLNIINIDEPDMFAVQEHGGGIGPKQHWQSMMPEGQPQELINRYLAIDAENDVDAVRAAIQAISRDPELGANSKSRLLGQIGMIIRRHRLPIGRSYYTYMQRYMEEQTNPKLDALIKNIQARVKKDDYQRPEIMKRVAQMVQQADPTIQDAMATAQQLVQQHGSGPTPAQTHIAGMKIVPTKLKPGETMQGINAYNQALGQASIYKVEETVTDVRAGMAEIYRRLAPKIERHRDSFLAGQLYDELENYAELHGAEGEFKRMMATARGRAHMEYDTNPGGFHNWFWFLPFEDNMEEGIKSQLAGAALAGALALGAGSANARVTGDEDPGVNRLTGKPNVTQAVQGDQVKPSAPTGFSKEYLQSVVDGTHPRPMITKEKAQALLNQLKEQGVAEGTDDVKKRMSKLEALALAANRAGDDAKCKMYQQKIQSLKQKLSQSMTEGSKPGEYYVHTVYFKDGTKKRIRVTSDEFDVVAYYTKRGQAVDRVDYDFQIHSDMTEDLVEGIKDTASATAVIACLLTGGSLSGCATAPQQTSAQQVLKTGQDIGRTVQTAKKITRAGTEAEVNQELRNILRGGVGAPQELNNSGILRVWRRLQGQPPVVPEPQAPEYGPADPVKRPAQFEAREIVSKEDFVRERDRLLRMIDQDTNPSNKQILKSTIRQLENRAENEGWITMQQRLVREDSNGGEAVEMAIMRRILVAHTDLIIEFGLDKVVQAIEEVAYDVGDTDEIGSSDVSGWVRQVKQILGADA